MQNLKRHPIFAYIGFELVGVLLMASIVQTLIVEAQIVQVPALGEPVITETKKEISIFHVGDMMFDRGVRSVMGKGFEPLSTFPKGGADFLIGNLEGPITTHTDCQTKAYNFRFDPSIAMMLRNAGLHAVSLANNHSLDCYRIGYNDTKRYLNDAGVISFGGFKVSESLATTTVHGYRLALIGIDTTIGQVPITEYAHLIRELASTTDIQVVSIHWGNEYELTESATQKMLAHAFIDAGAEAVFGHHPHVVQPIEIYKDKPIFYSLGNYIFDQTEPETKKGLAVKVSFEDTNLSTLELFPYRIERAVPQHLEHEARDAACAALTIYNHDRGTNSCHLDF